MKYGLIYRATCSKTGKSYIGKTVHCLETRIKWHKNSCRQKKQNKFYNAVRKYGWDSFKWEILKENVPAEDLYWCEIWFIATYDTKVNGYNSTIGGERGLDACLETRKKLSQYRKGKKYEEIFGEEKARDIKNRIAKIHQSLFTGSRNPMKDPKIAQRIASLHRGKKRTNETCRRISESRRKEKRPILQFTTEGEFIKKFDSLYDVVKELNIKFNYDIRRCCENKRKTAYGFKWKYAQ